MSRRILLADDSLTIQKVVELTFADTDFEVLAVSSGDDLLGKLPGCNPDIVICDVIMPGRDGYDVCQEIKSSPEYLHLPVILLTGTFEPFDRDRALAVGCSEIITKPFEAKRLVEAVEKLTSALGPSRDHSSSGVEAEVFNDGRVTPPPPIPAPDELVDVHASYDLADTAITAESEEVEADVESTEEGLDFTKSGFHEMETAGRERAERILGPPDEGLDFDLAGGDGGADGQYAPATDEGPPFEDNAFEVEDIGELSPEDPFATPVADDQPTVTDAAGDEPFPVVDEHGGEETPRTPDHDGNLTTPINVAEVMGAAPAVASVRGESFVATDSPDEADESNADTQDLGPKRESAPAGPEMPAASRELSDTDVDRIARRLLELSADRIDQIAWEVIPDMAEIVVRERLRDIEAEAEREGS